jgi:ABC-type transporter lipoprotein component MlaA
MRAMGYRKLSARPKHHAQAEGAIETFDELRQQIDPYTTLRRLYGRARAADIGIPYDEPNDAPELTDDELDF